MRLVIRANDATYRRAIKDAANHGRLPLAMLTIGYVSGLGWGFLAPWAQHALFPEKGKLAGVGNPRRNHDRFWLLRVWPKHITTTHPAVEWPITGRYWRGLAWREAFGYYHVWRIRIPLARWCLLDPDRIDRDWGERPREDW